LGPMDFRRKCTGPHRRSFVTWRAEPSFPFPLQRSNGGGGTNLRRFKSLESEEFFTFWFLTFLLRGLRIRDKNSCLWSNQNQEFLSLVQSKTRILVFGPIKDKNSCLWYYQRQEFLSLIEMQAGVPAVLRVSLFIWRMSMRASHTPKYIYLTMKSH